AGLDRDSTESAMAAPGAFVPQRVRKCSCDCRTEKSTCSSKWHGLDLVGRSYKFRQPRNSKTAAGKASRSNRPPGILSNARGQARAPEAARFNQLPGNQSRNAQTDFTRSRDQGQSESAFAQNAEQMADDKITAFLHTQTSGNRKGGRANGQNHAL